MTNQTRPSDNISLSALMAAHVNMNLGIFFTDVQTIGSLSIASSAIIPDVYWNYSYMLNGQRLDSDAIALAVDAMRRVRRDPAIWQLAVEPVPSGWQVASQEAWMWLDRRRWEGVERRPRPMFDHVGTHSHPSIEMRKIFQSAYSSGDGDVGYFCLPPEYCAAYAAGQPEPPAIALHFSGAVSGQCVSVASALHVDGIGGIYSVATSPGARRRGYGRGISYAAVEWLFAQGVRGILLQTEDASASERMYQSMGFETLYVGVLMTPRNADCTTS